MGAIDRLFTRRVATLQDGQIRYGFFCDERGWIVNDATVYRHSADRLWVITSLRSDGDHLRRHLAGDQLEVADITDQLAALQLQGPRSRTILAGECGAIAKLPYLRFLRHPVEIQGVRCWVSRIGFSGELGFELFCQDTDAPILWSALVGQGAGPYGLAAVQTLRIEAGLLMLGADFHPGHTSPVDLSIAPAVQLDGRTILGGEAMRRQAADHPRCMVTLQTQAVRVPPPGSTVLRGARAIGQVTSACRSPTLGATIALACVTHGAAEIGDRMAVAAGGHPVSASVIATPAYDRSKRRRLG